MYTYESSEQGDLTFQQGDLILVTKKDGDWWTGTVGDKSGVFPSNYVRLKDSEVTTSTVSSPCLCALLSDGGALCWVLLNSGPTCSCLTVSCSTVGQALASFGQNSRMKWRLHWGGGGAGGGGSSLHHPPCSRVKCTPT